MNYNEWRDELKTNLLCVSDGERRRVLNYYAEAYADRRDAGFSEREIIEEFGAPYDAAQRILYEREDNGEDAVKTRREIKRENREKRRERQNGYNAPPPPYQNQPPQPLPPYAVRPQHINPPTEKKGYGWVFALLCIIFCIPIFVITMAMVGITLGFCIAPVGVIAASAVKCVTSFITMAGGEIASGFYSLGVGVMTLGAGIILCPVLFKLVKLMWKLFKGFFAWIKSLFTGRRYA